jgi:hypothetical protein
MKTNDVRDGNGHPNQINLTFIVNGQPVEVKANLNAPLKTAVLKALHDSENTGRPIEDWQVKWNGVILDINLKVEDLHITNGAELHLSLRAGEGGSYV